jgi:hypothetical protein
MSARRSFFRPRSGWLLLVLSLAGCRGGDSFYPVDGQLVYEDNGEPVKELAGYDLTFTSEKLGKSWRTTIKEDGVFELKAPPGEYVVILTQPHRKPERPFVGNPVVDLAYEDPGKSDLKAEVKPENNHFPFKLRRLKPR